MTQQVQRILEVYAGRDIDEFYVDTSLEWNGEYVKDSAICVGSSPSLEAAIDLAVMAAKEETFGEIRFTGLEEGGTA